MAKIEYALILMSEGGSIVLDSTKRQIHSAEHFLAALDWAGRQSPPWRIAATGEFGSAGRGDEIILARER
jgi:hypothetical protein